MSSDDRKKIAASLTAEQKLRGGRVVPVEQVPMFGRVRTGIIDSKKGTVKVATAIIEPKEPDATVWRALVSAAPTRALLEHGHPCLVDFRPPSPEELLRPTT